MNHMENSTKIIELSKPIEQPSKTPEASAQELVDAAKGQVELEETFFKQLKMDRTKFYDSMRKFDERGTAEPTETLEDEHWRLMQYFDKEELAYIAVTKQQEAIQLSNMLSDILSKARTQQPQPKRPSIILPRQ